MKASTKQLSGAANAAERVPDLVSEAGREPREPREAASEALSSGVCFRVRCRGDDENDLTGLGSWRTRDRDLGPCPRSIPRHCGCGATRGSLEDPIDDGPGVRRRDLHEQGVPEASTGTSEERVGATLGDQNSSVLHEQNPHREVAQEQVRSLGAGAHSSIAVLTSIASPAMLLG